MLKPYENYKDIDAPWLDIIPTSWQEKRIRELFVERSTKVSDKDFSPLSVSRKGVVPQLESAVKTDNGDNRKLVCKKDFVVNSRSDRKGSSGISNYDGSVSLINIVLQPRSDINEKYFHYLLRSKLFIEEFYRNGRGIVSDLWTTRYSEMKNITVPFPAEKEQDKIIQYLDWKCADIHKMIKKKKKEIKLLQEQVNSIYNDLLFGKNSNVEMKDSNVVWMGKIPKQWNICTMKQLFSIKKDIAGMEGIDVISVTQSGLKIKNTESNEGQMAKSYANYQRVKYNDFVMNHMDLLTGWIDCAKIEGVTSPDYRVFVVNDEKLIDREYFLVLFQLFYKRKIFFGYGQGIATSGRWRLPKTNFLNMPVPLPPKKEQEKIFVKIKGETEKLFFILARIEDEIKLLNEYRIRLISDVVTGKVDVRNIIIPSFEPDTDESRSEDEADDVEELEDEVDADE